MTLQRLVAAALTAGSCCAPPATAQPTATTAETVSFAPGTSGMVISDRLS